MPKKKGKEVYDEIKTVNPHIKVIFTSGYNADIIHKKGHITRRASPYCKTCFTI
jgi:hypothetical protein